MTGPPRRVSTERFGLRFAPDVSLALTWAALGLWSSFTADSPVTVAVVVIVIGTSLAVGLFRRAPAVALALMWVTCVIQAFSLTDLLAAQTGVVVVAYGTARYGRPRTVWLAGVSILVGSALAEYYVFAHRAVLPAAVDVAAPLLRHTGLGIASVFLLGCAIPGIPWAVGLLVRLNARYERSAAEQEVTLARAAAAEQTAQLRAQQTELARDVHDLVGHSLAVIIAQADAAQLAAGKPDGTTRLALENIAAVARSSLGEVRDVLAHTGESVHAGSRESNLHALVDRARTAGNNVTESIEGTPTAIPPETQATLYRVLQEMLTNAIKHGRQGGRIGIAHTWEPGAYTVSVTNLVRRAPKSNGTAAADAHWEGMGLRGIRGRLQDIGGTLEIADGSTDSVFAATAHLPLQQFRAPS